MILHITRFFFYILFVSFMNILNSMHRFWSLLLVGNECTSNNYHPMQMIQLSKKNALFMQEQLWLSTTSFKLLSWNWHAFLTNIEWFPIAFFMVFNFTGSHPRLKDPSPSIYLTHSLMGEREEIIYAFPKSVSAKVNAAGEVRIQWKSRTRYGSNIQYTNE